MNPIIDNLQDYTYLRDTRNIGIGIDDPQAYLHIQKKNSDPVYPEHDFSGKHNLTEYVRLTSSGDSGDVNSVSVGLKVGGDHTTYSAPNGRLDVCANLAANAGNGYGAIPNNTIATFLGNGNVGIGHTNPFCKLVIWGTANGYANDSTRRAYFHNASTTALTHDYNGGSGVSVWSQDWIGSGAGFIATNATTFSDERIKKNIVDADDGECLDIFRRLKPKKYNYIDVVQRGETPVWGFIAQQVEEILPYSTHKFQEYIPNIYELGNVSSSNVITFTNFNTSNLEANATTIQVKTVNGGQENVTLTEVIDEHTIRVEEDLSDWTGSVDETGNVVAGNQLFIFGQRMEDVRGLKKDAIWTITTAAVQQLDRELQEEKQKVADLLARVALLESRVFET